MAPITMLRQIVKNGWTIANRKAIISQIGKSNFDEITLLAKKTGRTGDIFRFCDAKRFLRPNEISATKEKTVPAPSFICSLKRSLIGRKTKN